MDADTKTKADGKTLFAFKVVVWSGESGESGEIDSVEKVESSLETVWAEIGESHGGPERNKFTEYIMAVDENAARAEALNRYQRRHRQEVEGA